MRYPKDSPIRAIPPGQISPDVSYRGKSPLRRRSSDISRRSPSPRRHRTSRHRRRSHSPIGRRSSSSRRRRGLPPYRRYSPTTDRYRSGSKEARPHVHRVPQRSNSYVNYTFHPDVEEDDLLGRGAGR